MRSAAQTRIVDRGDANGSGARRCQARTDGFAHATGLHAASAQRGTAANPAPPTLGPPPTPQPLTHPTPNAVLENSHSSALAEKRACIYSAEGAGAKWTALALIGNRPFVPACAVALSRRHQDRSTMPPMSFLGLVTKAGFMKKTATVTVSRWVIDKKTGKRISRSKKFLVHDEKKPASCR